MALATIADLNGPVEEVKEKIEVVKKLSAMYDDLLDNYREVQEDNRKPGIHASELNSCLLKTFYSLVLLEKRHKISAAWQKRFEVGHSVHAMVQRQLRKMAIRENAKKLARNQALLNGWHLSFQEEVEVAPELQPLAAYYKFESSCDGVFTFRDIDENGPIVLRVGLEIKTEAPDSYDKLKEPKLPHVEQAHLYMAALDLPVIWFFYFNKGNQNNTPSTSPWIVFFNHTIWDKLKTRAEIVLEAEKSGVPPAKEEGMHCEFCPYSWHCKPKYLAWKNKQTVQVRRTGK